MPTVAAVRACKAASGSVAGAYSTRAPEAERGGVVGQGDRGKEKLNESIVRRLVFGRILSALVRTFLLK